MQKIKKKKKNHNEEQLACAKKVNFQKKIYKGIINCQYTNLSAKSQWMCFIFISIRPNIQPCPNDLLEYTTNVFHPVRTGGLSANSRVVLGETGEIWDGNPKCLASASNRRLHTMRWMLTRLHFPGERQGWKEMGPWYHHQKGHKHFPSQEKGRTDNLWVLHVFRQVGCLHLKAYVGSFSSYGVANNCSSLTFSSLFNFTFRVGDSVGQTENQRLAQLLWRVETQRRLSGSCLNSRFGQETRICIFYGPN